MVQRTVTITGIMLTNSRSAANKLSVRMVLLASSLRPQVTRTAAPAFAATETRKTGSCGFHYSGSNLIWVVQLREERKKSQVSQVKGMNVKVCIHAGWKGTKCEMHTLLTPADKQKNECWQMLIRSKREEKGWRLDFLMLFALQCLKGSLCIFTLSDDVMMCLLTFGHKNMNLVCCLPNK